MTKLRNIIGLDSLPDDVIIYELRGQTYMRRKSSLTRNRVLKSKSYKNTRKYARDMGRASKIASAIYKEISPALKDRRKYQAMAGMAASLIYHGMAEEQVKEALRKKNGSDAKLFHG